MTLQIAGLFPFWTVPILIVSCVYRQVLKAVIEVLHSTVKLWFAVFLRRLQNLIAHRTTSSIFLSQFLL